MKGFPNMSILPPGMDGTSAGALQNWQQNVENTIARTEPRTARRTRGELQSTIRTVTPEPNNENSLFEISSSDQTSPRSLPGGERPQEKRQALAFNDSYSTDSLESAPRSGPPISFHSQSRPRTRTMEEQGRNRSTSNTTAASRSRHRIGSVSSSVQDIEPRSTPNSWKSSEIPSIPTRSPSQLGKVGSKKEKGRRLVKRTRPSSPHRGVQEVPSIDSLMYPMVVGDPTKILFLMRTLCGRMKGDAEFQAGEYEPWQEGICYIDDAKGSLICEQDDDGPFEVTLIQDLRGCRVRSTTLQKGEGKCLEVISPTGLLELRFVPIPLTEHDLWLAALLCFQQIRSSSGAFSSSYGTPQSSWENSGLLRSEPARANSSNNIIKVAKLLLWDKGPPDSSYAVVKRPSTGSTGSVREAARSWRRVSCILQDNGEFKLLTENDVTLLSVIHLSHLARCAIQRIDKSVLGEEYCIGILPQYAPNASQLSIFRPVYIALESRLLMEVWYCLLRAFCVPEIYGPGPENEADKAGAHATPGQGMFRIEKSISVRLTEAKVRLSSSKNEKTNPPYIGKSKSEHDPSVGDYLAEVILDDEVRARTMKKTETRNPFWREDFEFYDLPTSLPRLSVVVRRIDQRAVNKAALSSSSIHTADHSIEYICGTADISTDTLDKGKDVERWCEIRDDQQQSVGELFLKIRHDELVVLMAKDYQPISELLHNFSSGLTQEIAHIMPANLKKLTEILINIFQVSGHAGSWLMALVEDEIDGVGREVPLTQRLRRSRRMGSNESFGSSSDREQTVRAMGRSLDNEANLLFRGNSLLTQSLDFHMRRLGKEYLEEVLSEKIRAIDSLNPDCEVDPSRVSVSDDLGRNWASLIALTTDVWDGIAESANRCPAELRQILKYIRSCAEDRFGDYLRSAPYTSISGFLFLRFFCPAILNPKLFGLLPDHPRPKAQRTLTLIAKSLQALANLSHFGQKEEWMEPMNKFLNTHRTGLKDFLDMVCSIPSERNTIALPASYSTPITILARLPPTSREGFPSLPYLIDHARNFASLIKLWLDYAPTEVECQQDSDLLKFHRRCIDLQSRTDDCLGIVSSNPSQEHRLSLDWDDMVDNSSPSTPAQDVDLPRLPRNEAEVLRSPRWAEYTATISSSHSQGQSSPDGFKPGLPTQRDHGPSSEVDIDDAVPSPSVPYSPQGQIYTSPAPVASDNVPRYTHVRTQTRPATAVGSAPSQSQSHLHSSGSQRDRRSKDKKRHSLTLVSKEKDMGHKSATSEAGLASSSQTSSTLPLSHVSREQDGSRGGMGSRDSRARDKDRGKERRKDKDKESDREKDREKVERAMNFLGLARKKKDEEPGSAKNKDTTPESCTRERPDPRDRYGAKHFGDGIGY